MSQPAVSRFARSIYLLGVMAFATAGVTTAGVTTAGLAQGFDLRSLFGFGGGTSSTATTGTVPPTAPAPGAAPEWSGEAGASGHPLMTVDAIRSAAANFRECIEAHWPLAERRGVSRAVFDANVAGLTPDMRIMDL